MKVYCIISRKMIEYLAEMEQPHTRRVGICSVDAPVCRPCFVERESNSSTVAIDIGMSLERERKQCCVLSAFEKFRSQSIYGAAFLIINDAILLQYGV